MSNDETAKEVEAPKIPAYEPLQKQIDALEKASFDYEDSAGNKAARSHVHKLRLLKGELDRIRKEEKAESLAYGRLVDSEAKKISAVIEAAIEPHAEQIRAIEQRETSRVTALKERVNWIREAAASTAEDGSLWGSNYLTDKLEQVRAIPLDDSWQEFLAEAGQAKDSALSMLEEFVKTATKREQDALELQRLREEQAENARKEERRRIAEEAATKERNRLEAKAKAEREAADKEKRDAQEAHDKALRDAEEKAAQEKADAERALKEQQAAAERRELELKLEAESKERARLDAEQAKQREREERERNEANRRSVHTKIVKSLEEIGIDRNDAKKVLKGMMAGHVPHVTISY